MARLPFSVDPLSLQMNAEVADLGARGIAVAGEAAPKPAESGAAVTKAAIDKIAIETRVPANILMALAEKDGAQDGPSAIAAAQKHAAALAGKDLGTLDGVLLDRADAIGKALYAGATNTVSVTKKEGRTGGEVASDLGKGLDATMGRIGAGMVSGLGTAIDESLPDGNRIATDPRTGKRRVVTDEGLPGTMVGRGLRNVADKMASRADAIAGTRSEIAQANEADFLDPTADAFKGEFRLGKNPTLEGAAYAAMNLFGSMAPVVATAIATKGRSVAAPAAVGGLIGGGSAGMDAAEQIDRMAQEVGEDGRSRLEKESKVYRGYLSEGMKPAEALERTRDEARRVATLLTAPVSTLGGALTGGIVTRPLGALAGRGIPAAVLGTGVASAIEEGVQEVAEGVAQRAGMNIGAGTSESVTEGSFSNALLGAVGGGAVGAASGLGNRERTPASPPEAAPIPPEAAPPTPGPTPPTGPGYPIAPEGADLDPLAPAGPAAPAAPPMAPPPEPVPPAPPPRPRGPLSRALEAVAPPPPPAPFYAGQPGDEIRVTDAITGEVFDGLFIEETPDGALVNMGGSDMLITRDDLERGLAGIEPAPRTTPLIPPAAAAPALTESAEAEPDGTLRPHADDDGRGAEPAPPQGDNEPGVQRDPALAQQPAGSGTGADVAGAEPAPVAGSGDAEGLAGHADAGDLDVPVAAPAAADKTDETPAAPQEVTENGTSPVPETDADYAGNYSDPIPAPANAGNAAPQPTIAPIRTKAAVLRGWPKDSPPAVPGVGLKWDEREGGFIFSRKHSEAVQAAVDGELNALRSVDEPPAADAAPHVSETPKTEQVADDVLTPAPDAARPAPARPDFTYTADSMDEGLKTWAEVGGNPGLEAQRDLARRLAALSDEDWQKVAPEFDQAGRYNPAHGPVTQDGLDRLDELLGIAPAPVAAAAEETHAEPTDAQKEAENYKTGKASWNGLRLSVENKKGTERSGTDASGKPWSVTMPAHYGRILRTEGADGDHVDFYMGDDEDSEFVLIVDQKDLGTGAFDEHKAILGTRDPAEAISIYKAGFSDGRGGDRIGGVREFARDEFKDWLKTGDTTKPASPQFAGQNRKPGQDGDNPKVSATAAQEPASEPMALFDAAGFTTGRDPAARVLAGERNGNGSKWVVRAAGAKFRMTRFGDETPNGGHPIAGVTITLGVFDSAQAALEAARKDGAPITDAASAPRVPPRPIIDGGRAAGEWTMANAARRSKILRDSGLAIPDDSAMVKQPWVDLDEGIRGSIEAAKNGRAPSGGIETDQAPAINPPAAAEPAPELSDDDLLTAAMDDVFGDDPEPAPAPAPAPKAARASKPKGEAQPRAARKPRTASEAAASAAQNTAEGVAGLVSGLEALFGSKPNRLNSGFAFDEATYAQAKSMFVGAVQAFGRAGQDLGDLARAMVQGLRQNGLTRGAVENMRPYLTRFIADMRSGAVDPFADPEPRVTMDQEDDTDDNRPDASDDRAGAEAGAGVAGPRPGRDGDGGASGSEPGTRDAGPGRDDQRAGSERGADDQRAGVPGRAGGTDRVTPPKVGPRNHVIDTGDLRVKGGEKTRARNSVKAIEMLRTLEAEGREANDRERQVLALYGGAGTLAAALPNSQGKVRMTDIGANLDRLLTPEEKASLEKTSQYAFYTAEPVLRGMWSMAQQLGFTGGKVFEPGMGVGGFVGTMPKDVFADYRGIELDPITAKIAAKLYPNSRIEQGDYIKTPMLRDFYDLVIGNPPFSRTQILSDPAYPQGFMIHDYFFAKSLDSVRPGGLLMFVTSAGTLNKMDTAARDYLADRADLVGAIRLPNTAFEENGTQVTTDIIVLRKRLPGEAEADPSWRASPPVEVPGKDGGTETLPVNAYFQSHPEMILGEQGAFDTLVGRPRIGVRARPGADLAADLAAAIARLPRGIMSEASAVQMMTGPRDDTSDETKSGSFYIKDGDLWQFDGQEGRKVEGRGKGVKGGRTKGDIDLITDLIPLRNSLRAVYAADLGDEDATAARKRLNDAYDAFVAKRGPINKVVRTLRRPSVVEMEGLRQQAIEDARASGASYDIGSFDGGALIAEGATLAQVAAARAEAAAQPGYREGDFDPAAVPDKVLTSFPNIDAFSDDPENFRLRAIEHYDERTDSATKTRVFSENAVKRSVSARINSPEDALLAQLAESGRIDIARIAQAANTTPEAAREELAGKIFLNPITGDYETRSRYLSGNVRQKLTEARDALARDRSMAANVEALEAVQPAPIPRTEISVPLGAHWFDAGLYTEFAASKGLRLKAEFKRALGIWTVDGETKSAPSRNEFGTDDLPFADLMRRAMNNKPIKVTRTAKDPDGSTRSWVDDEATQAANDKAAELREMFTDWLWSDEDRAGRLEDAYNHTFNAEVAPAYDGGYLTTPGVHSDWRWRPHQTAVVARILQSGNTYMAHTVGAGKTSAMIGAGMEARRLGLARKPMYAVPNHMLVQFATEFQHQYPLANILVADEKRFEADKRKQFVADAALGDYDAIIITHSAMGKIPNSEAAKARVVEGILSDIREMMASGADTGDRGADAGQQQATLGALTSVAAALGIKVEKEKGVSTAKKIAQMMEQAEQRITRMTTDTRKDDVFTMDELGVDMLFVDEAHLFRKLSFATTNGNIKGIDMAGSQAAMDLFIKSRIVDERNPGRGLIFASGTPITNTMAELYTVSRFLQPEALEARGAGAFDAWAATFGEVASELEQSADGSYKEVARFSRFVNTPELSLMVRQVMDVVSGPDLEKYVTRPKLKGGRRSLVVVEATAEQRAYQETLASRMAAIANRKGPTKKGDDILLTVINDGRLSAIDPRLVDPDASGDGSKLERMIHNIYRRWKEGADVPLHGVKPEGGYTDAPIMRGPSTQIVFSTLGVEATKHNPDFSVHRYIKASLVRMGVPAGEIVMSGDLKTHARKQRAFNDMNEGKARILIGSKSLFTGVNAQKRIAAIHNLDPLWFPADDEQRNGRGIRQGNMNPEIEVLDYSTKGTYDATMWQMMGRKAGFIEAFFRGDPSQRDMEDLGEASVFEQAKAMTTRDPRVLQLTELKAERDKMQRRAGAVDTQRARLRAEIRSNATARDAARKRAAENAAIAETVVDLSGEAFTAKVDGKAFAKRKEFGEALIEAAERVAEKGNSESQPVGSISGFTIFAQFRKTDRSVGFWLRLGDGHEADIGWSDDPVGLARRVEGATHQPADHKAFYEKQARQYAQRAEDAKVALAKVKDFAEGETLDRLNGEISALQAAMLADAAKEQRDMGDQGPVATLRGDELGEWANMVELQRKAQQWYRDNLQGRSVVNRATGWDIRFTRSGAGKVRGKPIDYLLRAIPALEQVVAEAVKVGEAHDRRDRDHIKAFHYFTALVEIGGRRETVSIVVREMDDGRKFYDLNLGDHVGARTQGPMDARESRVEPDAKVGADTFNLAITPAPVNGPNRAFAPADARRVTVAARERLAALLPDADVEVVPGRAGVLGEAQGRIARLFRTDDGWRHTLDHEAVHILRGRGLIRPDEWTALVREVRKRPDLMARVATAYRDLDTMGQMEEAVAELFADWRQAREGAGVVQRAFERIASVFRALGSALRGEGFIDGALAMERIASGTVGGRGPDGGAPRGPDGRFTAAQEQRDMGSSEPQERALVARILDGAATWASKNGREMAGDAAAMARDVGRFARALPGEVRKRGSGEGLSFGLTDAMAGGQGGQWSVLGLVPGRALFMELSKDLASSRVYLREKGAMDALRNAWHARADETAQAWRKLLVDKEMNATLMDLMHEATLTQVDPSQDFEPAATKRHHDLVDDPTASDRQREWAAAAIARDGRRHTSWTAMRDRFKAMPAEYRAMFAKVRDEYGAMADAQEDAIIENIEKSMKAAARKAKDAHDKRIREIADEGLTGTEKDEAIKDAKDALTRAKARAAFQTRAKVAGMRKQFEANRLAGPYFPLARFGEFFVTLRDKDGGQVESFSLFETAREQAVWAKQAKAEGYDVQIGVMSNSDEVRGAVDPGFVAEIQAMLGDAGVDETVMDQVWQHFLNTLPDMSIRKNRIHRKGRAGFSRDAFRAFGRQMFHGAHQLARLKHGVPMSEALAEMEKEVAAAKDPVRAGLVVNEMNRRHGYTMNPTGHAWTQYASTGAFVWHLAMSPAAAMVNVTQTTVIGIPLMGAAFRAQGVQGASAEVARALSDFTRGRGHAAESRRLSGQERAALNEGYARSVIDKSQAHDLAGVGETGVEYSDVRARWMGKLSWAFHHTERMNREVTFLASYRMARKDGSDHDSAINTASDLTWKVHFDYQASSRPRIMQGDFPKVLLTFRNYSINVLWRLFRDSHQAILAESPEDRAIARRQLMGITASMALHAGIRGTWGYGLLMTLAGMFFPGGGDDAEEELKKLLVGDANDDGTMAAIRRNVGGMLLNGGLGHMTGTDLSQRIGMGNLWFRDNGRMEEGRDAYLSLLDQLAGPAIGTALSTPFSVAKDMGDGQYQRALETAVPKFVRDGMKAARYATEGVTTRKGDDIVPDVSVTQAIAQAIGFTPAQVAERYAENSRMMNKQERIMGERSAIQREAGDAIMAGKPVSGAVLKKIIAWNAEYPEYPITGDTLEQSVSSRRRASARNEFGVALNPRLNDRIRREQAAMVYD